MSCKSVMNPDLKFEVRKERLSVRDVFERYQDSFPFIIEVIQGHFGDTDMDTYSTGHVMRIHGYSKQKRVVAKDNAGRHLSFATDYPIKFKLLMKHDKAGKEQSLREIIEKNTLPLKVELCPPPPGFSLHVGQTEQVLIGKLHLSEIYEETYLLGNSITDGRFDEEVLYVPIYLQNLVVATVSGIKGVPQQEFDHLQRQLNKTADTAVIYEPFGGNSDIAVYSCTSGVQSTENIYDRLEPKHFIKYRETYGKLKSPKRRTSVHDIAKKLEHTLLPKVPPKPGKPPPPSATASVQASKPPPVPVRKSSSIRQPTNQKMQVHSESVVWKQRYTFQLEKTHATVMEIYERHRNKMPFLMEITIGNYAEIDLETFGGGQVFRVSKVSAQKRVIARDIQGRYLTIPVNLPVKFRTVKGYKKIGPIQTLEEILEKNQLPVSVQFAVSPEETFKIGSAASKLYQFGNILLTEVYEEKYLLANSVIDSLLYEHVIVIPLYLKEIMVAKITGIVGRDKTEWETFLLELSETEKKIKYDLGMGNKDIALLPEDCPLITSENIYDFIDPDAFVDVMRRKEARNGRQNAPKLPERPSEGTYCEIIQKPTGKQPKLTSRNYSFTELKPNSPTAVINEMKAGKSSSRELDNDEAFFSGGSIHGNEAYISGGSIRSVESNDFVQEYRIDEISQSLATLQLDKYIAPLRKSQIDGAFLLSLNENILTEDFGMKKHEAVKLMLFARTGHLPK